jgi:hypothetical protein
MEKIALDLSLVLAPYFQTLRIITIPFPNAPFAKWSIFFWVGSIRWRATNVLSVSKAEQQCMRIQSPSSL